MSGRYASIILVTVILAAVALIGYLWPGSDTLLPVRPVPDRVLLQNTAGKVVFDHKTHSEIYKIECVVCHHERSKPTPTVSPCGTCHGAVDKPGFKETHGKNFKEQMTCVTCHHMEFAGKPAGESCPRTQSNEDGMKRCGTCHVLVETRGILREKGWVAIDPAYANCTVCHVNQAIDDLVPGSMQAFHTTCIGCHEKQGKGPFGQDKCNQCHIK